MNKNDRNLIFEGYANSVVNKKPTPKAADLIQLAESIQTSKDENVKQLVERLVTTSATDARHILKSIKTRDASLLAEMVKDTIDGKYGSSLGPKLENLIGEVGKILKSEKSK